MPDAQRGLADLVLDPSKPAPLRQSAAAMLVRSIQRFGPLLAADQEVRLLAAYDQESDLALRTSLAAVVGACDPSPPSPASACSNTAWPRPRLQPRASPRLPLLGSDLSRFRDPQSRNGVPSPREQAVIAVGA